MTQMKRSTALLLALSLTLCTLTGTALAADDPLYPVDGISSELYGWDDGAVDMSHPLDSVPYGKAFYVPLLNGDYLADGNQTGLKQDLDAAIAAWLAPGTAPNSVLADMGAAYQTADSLRKLSADVFFDTFETKKKAAEAAAGLPGATEAQIALNAAYLAAKVPAENLSTAMRTLEWGGGAQRPRARSTADPYPFVFESAAGKSIHANDRWEDGRDLVRSVEVGKRKMSFDRQPSWLSDLSKRYAYFMIVTLKPSNSTSSRELYGTVRLRKSGSAGFDLDADISVEVRHNEASSANVIPKLPALFEEGNGFFGEPDEIFYFEEDDRSSFTVNTTGQHTLLLGMNIDYDAELAEQYFDANLEFWNGNGRSFNKTGLLSLAAAEGSYLYQVDGDGVLHPVKARYDEYEGAFQIKTRTLGRYVISDQRLTPREPPAEPDPDFGTASQPGDSGFVPDVTITVTPAPPTIGIGNVNPPMGAAL